MLGCGGADRCRNGGGLIGAGLCVELHQEGEKTGSRICGGSNLNMSNIEQPALRVRVNLPKGYHWGDRLEQVIFTDFSSVASYRW
jgi:hypothetical protein